MLHELRAVVGEDRLKRVGKDLCHDFEELPSRQGSMALSGPGKSEAGVVIGKGDDIAADAVEKVLHRVKGTALSGGAGFISLGLSALQIGFSLDSLTFGAEFNRVATHLVGTIGDDPADGSGFRTAQLSGLTEDLQERIKLLFAQIGMRFSQPADLIEDLFRPQPFSSFPGCSGLLMERLNIFLAVSELLSPVIERSTVDLEGLHRRLKSVSLPK